MQDNPIDNNSVVLLSLKPSTYSLLLPFDILFTSLLVTTKPYIVNIAICCRPLQQCKLTKIKKAVDIVSLKGAISPCLCRQLFLFSFQDKLPDDDIAVPLCELPDPDADNGATGESVRQQENKWNDLALNDLVS